MKTIFKVLMLKPHGATIPVSITATSGTPQSANCGAAYAAPLVATITPAIAEVSVTFTAPGSGASGTFASTGINTETVFTDATGKATSTAFTANGTGSASAYTVTATAGALSCNFSLTNNWTWFYYNTSLNLPAWWRMRDTSGTTVVNSGSLGSALNLTATAWTMNQVGQLGVGEAGLADGANTRLQCANNATLANLTTWEWVFLLKPSSAGEGDVGRFFCWGNGASENIHTMGLFTAGRTLACALYNTTPTLFNTTISNTLPTASYTLVFIAYNDGGDRKVHIYLGASGVVTEASYLAQPAMTGTYKIPTQTLNLCNSADQARTFAGLADEVFVIGGRTFTDAERLQMVQSAGV